jgi:hypothetical protein
MSVDQRLGSQESVARGTFGVLLDECVNNWRRWRGYIRTQGVKVVVIRLPSL